jgi:hypothetical protein
LTAGLLGGAGGGLGAPTINAKKRRCPLREVTKLEIWEQPPSTLKNVDGGLMGDADGDLRASTINVKNVDGGPPGPRRGGPVPIRDSRGVL